ncbi:MAG TPA: multifunctional oxoglutarate decarboxylase/oxoglutarate dehydrogenase thiamine pyrophosphate-binding subunit/dihydrolipoyllysine-residue succinyltransferase subunit, partial [Gaiellaceae bacterium]|nr:multifunctional oxoglutarate decarboxylase/oxoglutarate dehydrogenase thiamine pyrophosphate-binding subunit/dihydrolipoyllysine-residue succinyltransferase subunit [Gaiellaceae bacterium]
FESGRSDVVATHPGLARLLERTGNGQPAPAPPPPAPPAEAEPVTDELLGAVAAAMALVKAQRMHGHLAARLDPLGSEPPGDPALEPERLIPKLTPELQARVPASVLRLYVPGETLAEALPRLRETYSGTIAYEIEHIADHEKRVWLRQAIESGKYRHELSVDERRELLASLSRVEAFEQYLRRAFLGQKQFSIEGLDVMVPMLDEAIELAAENGAHEVVIGMAHRGRLNVLAHTLGLGYDSIIREFEGERTIEAVVATDEGGTGDVKYHLGAEGTRSTPAGEITVTLAANPSHLEAVDPVVEGRARAEQTDRSTRYGLHDPSVALPILIHGDASFPGQGEVAETLNLSALDGYSTGGTLHVIANNQVGFTTDPSEGRSTRYSSDLAKGFDVPIIHVNADDPEAAISAVRLALAFRRRFESDVVVDLVGYRRHGHNEQDEAAYTQPLMAAQVAEHATVRDQFARRLVDEGVVTQDGADAFVASVTSELKQAHEALKATFGTPPASEGRIPYSTGDGVVTAVAADRLRALNEELLQVPENFTIHPKLKSQLERRLQTIEEGGIDWGQAEALAFGSLLVEGIPIRLTGQDTERGTFSHRHAVLHDVHTGETYTPLQNVDEQTASFEIYNSPLSEYACLGFEYGYSVAAPEALVLWEAQFGDFVNGAQIVIDQFIVAGLSKWRETTRLTLLLPHGYEGNGPEHSSARLERFLQLAAQENIRVANCSTSGQYFHLLRRQALDAAGRPLVVMTPKGLLRLKQASSTLADLAQGSFRPVIDDPEADHAAVTRLVFCSGKLYYDIVGHEQRAAAGNVAIARLEQLYPFPVDAYAEVVSAYPNLEEVVWAQEEPQNMGAWRTIRHRLEAPRVPLTYAGRPWRASPSEGYPTAHLREQDRIVRAALGVS